MLNPDGVQKWQRQNAQGIDVNRDARRLTSPEGCLLQAAVDRIQPEFAFNLHNQHRLSAVGPALQPAAVSLLVPPPNPENRLDESAQRAVHVAASFAEAVHPYCQGAISRYRAEYMPRAFGESIQSQGVSTILVEAGSWLDHSASELARLHTFGLLATLVRISTGDYRSCDPSVYHSLPLSAEHRMFDVLRQLREDGRSIVLVTHKLDEVFAVAEAVTVLRAGRTVFEGPLRGLDSEAIARKMVGAGEPRPDPDSA